MEKLKIDASGASAIDDYLEYKRIVGDDDGGTPFTPKQYEEYKKKMLPIRAKNRLFVCWTNSAGLDCLLAGPETPCFCTHRLIQHRTDFEEIPSERPIKLFCEVKGCKCRRFTFMLKNGSQPIRCHCKHISTDHSPTEPYVCSTRNCKCMGFKSSFSCECSEAAHQHETVVETIAEREARGHPIGKPVPYKAMGGLTGFSSLTSGAQRFDPSGIGAPSEEFLSQPVTANDHAFLKSNLQSIKAYKMANNDLEGVMVDNEERLSQMRRPGESELDYYERRYQEREKKRFVTSSSSKPPAIDYQKTAPRK